MTDVSIDIESDFTGTNLDPAIIERRRESQDWNECRDEVLLYRSTGQEQEEAQIPGIEQETGSVEGSEVEDLLTPSLTTNIPLELQHREPAIWTAQPMLSSTPKPDPQAQLILRTHFTEKILIDLNQIQHYCGGSTAAVYADSLIQTMRTMEEISPFDPFVEIVMALHDALIYQDNWNKYSPDQYKSAYDLLKRLVQRSYISNDIVEKAIMELEKLGFDTTPYEIKIEFEDEEGGSD